jgi:hypothetical protein
MSFGKNPDLLVYAGVPSTMYLANEDAEADLRIIKNAIDNIKKITPKKLVLISSITVYNNPIGAEEDTEINIDELPTYGANRRYLEKWVEENLEDYLIVRLPALYGMNIKKNFIYDYINFIPAMLTEAKFCELRAKDNIISAYYVLQANGYYKCKEMKGEEKKHLKQYFEKTGFSALSLTDSRSKYQFYPLDMLWRHIEMALKLGIKVFNPATEPVSVEELYGFLSGRLFINHINKKPFDYDYRTKYAEKFGGRNGYILTKKEVMTDIRNFISSRLEMENGT